MSASVTDVAHVWEPPSGSGPVILALHGRGGSEQDLVSAAQLIAPGAGVLAPRGLEPQPPGWAWFAHRAIGVPVDASFDGRLAELVAWLEAAAVAYGIVVPMTALGFSNGGMMAGALVATRPELVDAAILMASGYRLPDHITARGGLAGHRILIAGGADDPFHTAAMMDAGVTAYTKAGADVVALRYPGVGHTITREQALDAAAWLTAPAPGNTV